MQIHEIIRTRRTALGLTQEQLAGKLGVSAPAVNKWERGNSYGGPIGSLSVPQGYMIFLLPAFENLLQAYLPLIHMIEESGMGIHISEGRLNLTPPQKRTL